MNVSVSCGEPGLWRTGPVGDFQDFVDVKSLFFRNLTFRKHFLFPCLILDTRYVLRSCNGTPLRGHKFLLLSSQLIYFKTITHVCKQNSVPVPFIFIYFSAVCIWGHVLRTLASQILMKQSHPQKHCSYWNAEPHQMFDTFFTDVPPLPQGAPGSKGPRGERGEAGSAVSTFNKKPLSLFN